MNPYTPFRINPNGSNAWIDKLEEQDKKLIEHAIRIAEKVSRVFPDTEVLAGGIETPLENPRMTIEIKFFHPRGLYKYGMRLNIEPYEDLPRKETELAWRAANALVKTLVKG